MFLCLELWQKHQCLLTQTYLYQLCHVRFDAEIHINRVTFTIRFELEVKTRTSNRDWKYNFLISIWRVIFEDCKNWAPNWPRQPVSTHLSRKNSWKHRWRPIQKTAWDFFLFTVVIWALWAGQSTDTGAGLNSGRLSLTKALVWKSTDTGVTGENSLLVSTYVTSWLTHFLEARLFRPNAKIDRSKVGTKRESSKWNVR